MAAGFEYCGLTLANAVGLPELDRSTLNLPEKLNLSEARSPGRRPDSWIHHWSKDSAVVLSLGRLDGRYVLSFDDGRTFDYERANCTVTYPSPLDSAARHQLLDQVLPRVLDDLGHLMIHGSAVNTSSGAVIFIGDTGLGKSTLAASFQDAGSELLSDDCMRLNVDPDAGVGCTPTYRSLRLWPDSSDAVMATAPFEPISANSAKRRLRLPATPPSSGPAKVAAICVLAAPSNGLDAIEFSHISPARAVSLLLAQCFRLDPTDLDANKRTFERCVDVVERVPVVELNYPRDYDRLSEVREAVLHRSKRGDWTTVTAR